MTNPHDETTGHQVDPNALAANSESDSTRLHGDGDETDQVQDTFGALAPVAADDADGGATGSS